MIKEKILFVLVLLTTAGSMYVFGKAMNMLGYSSGVHDGWEECNTAWGEVVDVKSGYTTRIGNGLEFRIVSFDHGKTWYAITDGGKIAGDIRQVYPGLLEILTASDDAIRSAAQRKEDRIL